MTIRPPKLYKPRPVKIALAGLRNGDCRASAPIHNRHDRISALVFAKITSGEAPTAGTGYGIYLYTSNHPIPKKDLEGNVDNWPNVAHVMIITPNANQSYYIPFNTSLGFRLLKYWGLIVRNNTGRTTHKHPSKHYIEYRYLSQAS